MVRYAKFKGKSVLQGTENGKLLIYVFIVHSPVIFSLRVHRVNPAINWTLRVLFSYLFSFLMEDPL